MPGLSTEEMLGSAVSIPSGGLSTDEMLGIASPGLDLSDPIKRLPEIRAQIAKLKGPEREAAVRQLADAYVAAERAASPSVEAADAGRAVARGSFAGPFLDEANAAIMGGLHAVTGGYAGAPYDETVEYNRARDRAFDTERPVLSTALKVGGGVAGGVGSVVSRAPGVLAPAGRVLAGGPLGTVAPAATVTGRAVQGVGIGGAYGAAAGAGDAEGDIGARFEGAARGVVPGMLVGGALPLGVDLVRGTSRAVANMADPARSAYERVLSSLGNEPIGSFSQRITGGVRGVSPGETWYMSRVLGEEMQRAGGDVGRAEAATVSRFARDFQITPAEATDRLRRFGQAHAENPLFFGEQPAVAGRPPQPQTQSTVTRLGEPPRPATGEAGAAVAGRTPTPEAIKAAGAVEEHALPTTIDYLAGTGGTAASNTRNAVVRRQVTQNEAFIERMRRLLPAGDTPEAAADLLDQVRATARREYASAYQRPINLGLMQRNMTRILQRHEMRAGGRAGEQADALRAALREFETPGGGPLHTLQQMQDARQAVRGMITRADRAGNTHIVGILQPLYRDITTVMERVSPMWARANRRWADGAASERGWDLGEMLTKKPSPTQREQLIEFGHMAPEAQRLARIGFIQKLEDMVSAKGDMHDISKLFQDDATRSLVRQVLGPRQALDLERAVRDQSVMIRSARAGGGSQTHARGVMREQMEGDPAIVGALTTGSTAGIKTALMNMARHLLAERRNRVLSDIVTTPMSDTPRVAQHLQRMRTEQRRLQRYEQPHVGTAAIGATAAGRLGSMTAPATVTGDGSHHSHYQSRSEDGKFRPTNDLMRP